MSYPTTEPKEQYLERLNAFHERPHGKEIDNLVSDYIHGFLQSTPRLMKAITPGRRASDNKHPLLMLELGCGAGHLAKRVALSHPLLHVVGIDPNYWRDADKLNNHRRIVYRQDFAPAPSFYDFVVCCNTLGHLPSPVLSLQDMRASLKPDGVLLLSVPSRLYEQSMTLKNLITGYRSDYSLLHRWYDWQLIAICKDLGLQLIAKHRVSQKGLLHESNFYAFTRS